MGNIKKTQNVIPETVEKTTNELKKIENSILIDKNLSAVSQKKIVENQQKNKKKLLSQETIND